MQPPFFVFGRFPYTGKMYNLRAKNNTRPGVMVKGKLRNMTNEEYKVHREQNQEKVGPQWELQSTETAEEINFNGAGDLRAILAEQWERVQQQKGWTLGEDWKAEAADYFFTGRRKNR